MNRRLFLFGSASAATAVLVAGSQFGSGGAQDDGPARISALETSVAVLTDRVATLEAVPASPVAAVVTAAAGAIVVSGVGQTVTDPFPLPVGPYTVTLAVTGAGGIVRVDMWSASNDSDGGLLFLQSFAASGSVEKSLRVGEGVSGFYLDVRIDAGVPWSVTFDPIG